MTTVADVEKQDVKIHLFHWPAFLTFQGSTQVKVVGSCPPTNPPTNPHSYLKKSPLPPPLSAKNAYLYRLDCLIRAFDEGWLTLAARSFSVSDKTKSTIYQ